MIRFVIFEITTMSAQAIAVSMINDTVVLPLVNGSTAAPPATVTAPAAPAPLVEPLIKVFLSPTRLLIMAKPYQN